MKKINITVSMPGEIHEKLQSYVGKKKISSFVSMAVKNELDKQINELKMAYKEADKDPDRKKLIEEWDKITLENWNE